MQKVNLSLLLLVVFLLGACAVMVAQEVIVPPVRAGTEPQKWEYTCPVIPQVWTDASQAKMNEYGSQGWELVLNVKDTHCLKRPL